jgi:hypothetical protein
MSNKVLGFLMLAVLTAVQAFAQAVEESLPTPKIVTHFWQTCLLVVGSIAIIAAGLWYWFRPLKAKDANDDDDDEAEEVASPAPSAGAPQAQLQKPAGVKKSMEVFREAISLAVAVCAFACTISIGFMVVPKLRSLESGLAAKADSSMVFDVARELQMDINNLSNNTSLSIDSLKAADEWAATQLGETSGRVADAVTIADRAKRAADAAKKVADRLAKQASATDSAVVGLRNNVANVEMAARTVSNNVDGLRKTQERLWTRADSVRTSDDNRLGWLEAADANRRLMALERILAAKKRK